jgi:ribonuclease Z
MSEKAFLVQKFAKIQYGAYHVIGYSVAGEETVVQVPELNICFDIGRCPYFALTSDIVCITHGHMDHIAGIPYYISQRHFQGMKPGTILLPADMERGVDALLKTWRDVEKQGTPYTLVPMTAGQVYEVRRDLAIKAVATHHGSVSLGYIAVNVREKLKAEYLPLTGPQIAALRKQGVEIQYRLEVPLFAFLGDTTAGKVFEDPDVRTAQVLITECTFFDAEHKGKAKAGRHLHVDHLIELLPKLHNEHILIGHVSRRIGIRRAKSILRKKIGQPAMANIQFLMDFEGAADAGDVDTAGPNPLPDAGE